jgi:hypothetical protein
MAGGLSPPADVSREAAAYYTEIAEYHVELQRKYTYAARYPWLVVNPDPVMPHDRRKSEFELARLLAGRLAAEIDRGTCACYATDASLTYNGAFVVLVFEEVLGRSPSVEERTEYEKYLDEQTERCKAGVSLETLEDDSLGRVAPATEPAQEARASLVQLLFNHNIYWRTR